MTEQTLVLTPAGQDCLQRLLQVWLAFERGLNRVPVIARLENGRFDLDDYRRLLLHLRQQVIEGSRWISRCASSFDRDFADVRSMVITHSKDEHRDYEILEQDFVNAGGALELIRNQPRNSGTEALHGYLMYRAGLSNPADLLGAMWIIEGLGQKMASSWADRIDELTGGDGRYTRFMRYHGDNDETHLAQLYRLLDRLCIDQAVADAIVMTATVTGKLYALQLEEIEHDENP